MKSVPYPHGESIVLVCTECKSKRVLRAVRDEVREQGLRKQVRVQKCGCLGACKEGPSVLVSNGRGLLFTDATPKDAPAIVKAAQGAA